MKDLIKLGEKTYCLKNPTNVGIYLIDDTNVCVIDTGASRESGEIIDKILIDNNWHLKYIINTHSHADHIGGNKYLQDKYKCEIYASRVESYFINDPLLEPATLYGANPIVDLKNPFLLAEASICKEIRDFKEDGLTIINLDGHSFGHIGVVTTDQVCFVGDAYTSIKKISKYAIQYIYDVDKYLKTIENLKNTNFKIYVPAHGEIENNPEETLRINEESTNDLSYQILKVIGKEIDFADLIKRVFEIYRINMNVVQYHLIVVTIKAFLTKLINERKVEIFYEDNIMKLRKVAI